MRSLGPAEVAAALPYPALIEALRTAFREGATVPTRSHHTVSTTGADATLLLMPAWSSAAQQAGEIGVKIVTVHPDNGGRGLPAVHGLYLLIDGETGQPRALLDGPTLTARRTAAASALAADSLARRDAASLLLVGTGVIAEQLAHAHAAVRPIAKVAVWGRNAANAAALADRLCAAGMRAAAVDDDLPAAVGEADIVSCATLSKAPLVQGDWLRPGQHLDLVGGFTPEMRETDDAAVTRARLFVDTRDGAFKEAGDIVDPMRRDIIAEGDVEADLYDLCRGTHAGRGEGGAGDITLFKSVGTAIEDLAAARLAVAERRKD